MPLVPGQQGIMQNPDFDRRMLPAGAVDKDGKFIQTRQKLYRGRIETADKIDGYIYRLQFLFNPTEFSHQAGMNTTLVSTQYMRDPVGDNSAFLEMNQTLSFNLLFDRTYETWDGRGTGYLRNWGVLADIKHLYALLGMYSDMGSNGDVASSSGAVVPDEVLQITPTAPMLWRPVWAVFGPKTKYFGTISGININYSHFTQQMTPNRATVQLSMQLIPKTDPKAYNPLSNTSTAGRYHLTQKNNANRRSGRLDLGPQAGG